MTRQTDNSDLINTSGDVTTQEELGYASTSNEKNTIKKKKKKCNSKGLVSRDNISIQKKSRNDSKLWVREKRTWQDFIKRHREYLKTVKAVVDDKPPPLNVTCLYDMEVLSSIREQLRYIFNPNIHMVKTLHEVNVLPGKTETFNFNYSLPHTTNYYERRERTKQIEERNLLLSKTLQNAQTRMKTVKDYAEEWKKNQFLMEGMSQFPLFWRVKKEGKPTVEVSPPVPHFQQYVTDKSSKYSDKRPRVFFEISMANIGVLGKMVAMLYSDYVPMTVKNFLAFCNPKADLTYKGNFFYFIFQNYYCQTGDVVENKGYGGTSIYGPYFGNEDLSLRHGQRGVLTMYQRMNNRNDSQFLITFRKLECLDGENVVFGKIIKGLHLLDAIESVGTKKTGRPKVKIYISDCDEI